MQSATTESQTNMRHDTDCTPPVNGVEDEDTASHASYVDGDHARYLYAKMLFEHTQRQYTRACNRIMRQQAQQKESEKRQLPNGV